MREAPAGQWSIEIARKIGISVPRKSSTERTAGGLPGGAVYDRSGRH